MPRQKDKYIVARAAIEIERLRRADLECIRTTAADVVIKAIDVEAFAPTM